MLLSVCGLEGAWSSRPSGCLSFVCIYVSFVIDSFLSSVLWVTVPDARTSHWLLRWFRRDVVQIATDCS
jgi:hypothetical protein